MGKTVVSETTLILWVHRYWSLHGHHVHGCSCNFDLAIVYILNENCEKIQIWTGNSKVGHGKDSLALMAICESMQLLLKILCFLQLLFCNLYQYIKEWWEGYNLWTQTQQTQDNKEISTPPLDSRKVWFKQNTYMVNSCYSQNFWNNCEKRRGQLLTLTDWWEGGWLHQWLIFEALLFWADAFWCSILV